MFQPRIEDLVTSTAHSHVQIGTSIRFRPRLLFAVALLLSVMAGCSGSDDQAPSTNSTTAAYFDTGDKIIYSGEKYQLFPFLRERDDMFSTVPYGAIVFARRDGDEPQATVKVIFLTGVTERNYTSATSGFYMTFRDRDPDSGDERLASPSVVVPIELLARKPVASPE